MTISKNNTKKYNSYNTFAINAISKKLNFSEQYVRQCVKGDKKSINADLIKMEYNALVKKINNLL